ncbi:MAG: hypothetical protein II767_10280 [Proteobacteria bacterium]|nr:hypothetical protein [Pseudomonadota bacterium]MBQ4360634.1 hypothetical protein [Pseudomonadota bacterium]
MKIRYFLMCLLLFVMCAASGCASLRYTAAHDQYITKEMKNYTFTTDFAKVWATARQLLFSSGYVVRDSGNGYTVETEWGAINETTMRRYLVTGYVNPDNTSSVHFDYVDQSHGYGAAPTMSSERDYVMEYELVKRVEHDRWVEIEQAAKAYATKQANK